MVVVYTAISVLIVSACSLAGLAALTFTKRFTGTVPLLVSISVGALLGDAFIHLIPETLVEDSLFAPILVIAGILGFYIFEHVLHWHHHTAAHEGRHDVEMINIDRDYQSTKPAGLVILTSDALHNMLDGLIIAASFIADIRLGIATTIAIILHEIPQELGDFGVLVHAGFTERQALNANVLSALCAFLGAGIGLLIAGSSEVILAAMLPLAAGGFIYIATADLIPELHKTRDRRIAFLQFFGVLLGIGAMLLLRIFGE